jgi:hypothetical protein
MNHKDQERFVNPSFAWTELYNFTLHLLDISRQIPPDSPGLLSSVNIEQMNKEHPISKGIQSLFLFNIRRSLFDIRY